MPTSSSSSSASDIRSIDPSVIHSEFAKQKASNSLRVTCYGSSSAKTPEKYLNHARSVGYLLAKRGHVCVNGAGSYGCMAAMNDGAVIGNGHIVGVIHEMFLVDGGDWVDRDGGAHNVFNKNMKNGNKDKANGPIREILVARGDDLQQRKKLLVENAEALLVLPGGPGTWDELWEMACMRHLGLTSLPIVCVNVDGYYDPFKTMLERAYEDELIKLKPNQIIHFASTAQEAIRWVEVQGNIKQQNQIQNKVNKRDPNSLDNQKETTGSTFTKALKHWAIPFVVGVAVGTLLSTQFGKSSSK